MRLAIVLVVLSASVARADLSSVSDAAQKTAAFVGSAFDRGGDDKEAAEAARRCLGEADAALASGVLPTTRINLQTAEEIRGAVRVSDKGQGTYHMEMPLAVLKENVCRPVLAAAVLHLLGSSASNAATWIDKSKNGDEEMRKLEILRVAIADGQDCMGKAKEALAAGVAPSTAVEFNEYESGLHSPLPLAQIGDRVCKPAVDLTSAAIKAALAQRARAYAPYLNMLKGDKRALFDKESVLSYAVRGHNGRSLTTPADFASSDVWYTSGLDLNRLFPEWNVGGWKFSGDKLVGKVSLHGLGSDYPARAFP